LSYFEAYCCGIIVTFNDLETSAGLELLLLVCKDYGIAGCFWMIDFISALLRHVGSVFLELFV